MGDIPTWMIKMRTWLGSTHPYPSREEQDAYAAANLTADQYAEFRRYFQSAAWLNEYAHALAALSNEELLGRYNLHKVREDTIEHMLDKYREELESQDDEELLGTETLEVLREDTIDKLVEKYRRENEGEQ